MKMHFNSASARLFVTILLICPSLSLLIHANDIKPAITYTAGSKGNKINTHNNTPREIQQEETKQTTTKPTYTMKTEIGEVNY